MAQERLDKVIASTGRWSRREVKALVRQGAVLVEGRPARSPEEKVDPETANMPAGYLSATEDGRGPTVLDLLPTELGRQGLFPVGRLDKDTEGLLLLTNEGGLAHDLLSPRHHVDKVYRVRVQGRLTEEDCRAFAAGMTLPDGTALRPASLVILSAGEESEGQVTLREGKFHQIKRMLAARGKPVVYLERVKMGNLPLDLALSRGGFRFLTENEVENLRQLSGGPGNR